MATMTLHVLGDGFSGCFVVLETCWVFTCSQFVAVSTMQVKLTTGNSASFFLCCGYIMTILYVIYCQVRGIHMTERRWRA